MQYTSDITSKVQIERAETFGIFLTSILFQNVTKIEREPFGHIKNFRKPKRENFELSHSAQKCKRGAFYFLSSILTKIVLSEVLQNFKAPNCTIWLRELNYNSCSFFRFEQPDKTKGSPLLFFFRHGKKFFFYVLPLQFLIFCNRMDVEKSQRVPRRAILALSVFRVL